MPCELHAHSMSRPQMMLTAVQKVRNEMNNAREYRLVRSQSSESENGKVAEQTKKRQRLTALDNLNQKIEQKVKASKDKFELKNVNKLMNTYMSINGGHAWCKGPKYHAIQTIFTYLACTEGLGFSAVAILETVFEASIKTLTQKIQEKMATQPPSDFNKKPYSGTFRAGGSPSGTEPEQAGQIMNTQIWPDIEDEETRRQLLNDFQLIKPGVYPLQDLDLGKYIMLAYTKEYELLMSKPSEPNKLPNYAIYLGQSNIFEYCSNLNETYFGDGGHALGLNFDENPVNTIAIDLQTVEGYNKETLKKFEKSCVWIYSQQRNKRKNSKDDIKDWYVLVYMEKLNSDCCAICLVDIEKIDPVGEHCVTECKHLFHKTCLQNLVTFERPDHSDTNVVSCPMCREPLHVTTSNAIECQGQAARGFTLTWVTYVMILERKLPILLKNYNDVTAGKDLNPELIDVDSDTRLKLLKDCTNILKGWFMRPNTGPAWNREYTPNEAIALVILLFKYYVLYISHSYPAQDASTLHYHAYQLMKCLRKETIVNWQWNTQLHFQVDEERYASISDYNISFKDTLEAEIESNLVFPKGYLTTA